MSNSMITLSSKIGTATYVKPQDIAAVHCFKAGVTSVYLDSEPSGYGRAPRSRVAFEVTETPEQVKAMIDAWHAQIDAICSRLPARAVPA